MSQRAFSSTGSFFFFLEDYKSSFFAAKILRFSSFSASFFSNFSSFSAASSSELCFFWIATRLNELDNVLMLLKTSSRSHNVSIVLLYISHHYFRRLWIKYIFTFQIKKIFSFTNVMIKCFSTHSSQNM